MRRCRQDSTSPPGSASVELESNESFHAIPLGSGTDYVQPLAAAFKPAFFPRDEFPAIRRMVALLLGLPLNVEDQRGRPANRKTWWKASHNGLTCG